ncbi:MAG TPA: hypothetical protein VIR55_06265 [Ignavibacteria bacterium]
MKKLRTLSKDNIIRSHRKMEDAIKEKCFDCMGGQKRIDCELDSCSLYLFRPWSKRSKLES